MKHIRDIFKSNYFFNKGFNNPGPLESGAPDAAFKFPQRLMPTWEFCGSIPGIIGALLLASAWPIGRYGWLAFLLSNLAWIVFSVRNRYRLMLYQQLAFLFCSSLGIYNNFLR